jgi:hypothetical protein
MDFEHAIGLLILLAIPVGAFFGVFYVLCLLNAKAKSKYR